MGLLLLTALAAFCAEGFEGAAPGHYLLRRSLRSGFARWEDGFISFGLTRLGRRAA